MGTSSNARTRVVRLVEGDFKYQFGNLVMIILKRLFATETDGKGVLFLSVESEMSRRSFINNA